MFATDALATVCNKTSQDDNTGIKKDERKAGTMNIEMQLQKKIKFPVLGAI